MRSDGLPLIPAHTIPPERDDAPLARLPPPSHQLDDDDDDGHQIIPARIPPPPKARRSETHPTSPKPLSIPPHSKVPPRINPTRTPPQPTLSHPHQSRPKNSNCFCQRMLSQVAHPRVIYPLEQTLNEFVDVYFRSACTHCFCWAHADSMLTCLCCPGVSALIFFV